MERKCIAFLLVPAYHKGPRGDVKEALGNGHLTNGSDRFLTHGLHYPEIRSYPVKGNGAMDYIMSPIKR